MLVDKGKEIVTVECVVWVSSVFSDCSLLSDIWRACGCHLVCLALLMVAELGVNMGYRRVASVDV